MVPKCARTIWVPPQKMPPKNKVNFLKLTCLFQKKGFSKILQDFTINYPLNCKCAEGF